mmetsp:Transcript_18839/g.51623  ORF Transcript_18839/g.51623 Transcript_18839/m.51623 type:complete len:161 (-) Transcript_18839:486-968(-)
MPFPMRLVSRIHQLMSGNKCATKPQMPRCTRHPRQNHHSTPHSSHHPPPPMTLHWMNLRYGLMVMLSMKFHLRNYTRMEIHILESRPAVIDKFPHIMAIVVPQQHGRSENYKVQNVPKEFELQGRKFELRSGGKKRTCYQEEEDEGCQEAHTKEGTTGKE